MEEESDEPSQTALRLAIELPGLGKVCDGIGMVAHAHRPIAADQRSAA